MARIRGRAGYKPQTYKKTEVFQWLKTLPVAPEFHPTIEEFQDPIAYIHKIEKEASVYGICKIIPPLSLPLKKTTILELNKSFLACSGSREGESRPAFTTRVQQVGFCPRKDHSVIRSVRESGQSYTLSEFEAKAKAFEKNHFKNSSIMKGVLSPLELETLYWDAQADKAIEVEYGNDMPGSAFIELHKRRSREGLRDNLNVGDTEWNLRGAARAKGCSLRFVKDDIPGVTSPMVYMGMMFSWFAWHVEDHDFHSLNYLHLGDAKTWYGVRSDAATAFEEVIRNHGYGGQRNLISTYETLAQKTTVISPEVILSAGIPCCRLVQNAGEFVVTFPRAYHSGFSHGFNCAEASNIATPEWLRYASEAAIRRAAVNSPPLVAHNQLLYDHAMSLSLRVPMSVEPSSSRLKERKKDDGENLVKEFFVQDVVHNTNLLHKLAKGSAALLLPLDFIEFPKLHDGFFSCITCGALCFAGAAIIRPSEMAAHKLMSVNNGSIEGRIAERSCNYLFDLPASCSRPPKDIPSLSLLALTYGDATDSATDSETESTNSHSSDASSIPGMVLPHVTATSSSVANRNESAKGSALVPVQNRGSLFAQTSDEDSSRSHVFCLQHAFEVEQKLCELGGMHMLLLCHPDYPKFQAEAKLMANDLGADHIWSNIDLRTATKADRESFNSGLNSEGSIQWNSDWTVKLGVNLLYSAELTHSLIYGKKIPDATPKNLSRSQTKRKSMADIEPTSSGKSPQAEELAEAADHAAKSKCIIVYERRKKLKEKVIQEETPEHERDRDQGAKQFELSKEEKPEGGPSTRLRQRSGKQPAKR